MQKVIKNQNQFGMKINGEYIHVSYRPSEYRMGLLHIIIRIPRRIGQKVIMDYIPEGLYEDEYNYFNKYEHCLSGCIEVENGKLLRDAAKEIASKIRFTKCVDYDASDHTPNTIKISIELLKIMG